MDVTIVLRKRISNPKVFDKLLADTKSACAPLEFDSVRSNFTYDPDTRKDGDVAFTSKDTL